jgi:hypothetical protein
MRAAYLAHPFWLDHSRNRRYEAHRPASWYFTDLVKNSILQVEVARLRVGKT